MDLVWVPAEWVSSGVTAFAQVRDWVPGSPRMGNCTQGPAGPESPKDLTEFPYELETWLM